MSLRISVITATWNCVETVEDCLRSVSQQTWVNREHVVIDGISSDGTVEALARHRENIGVLVSEPDEGIYDALNKGIARASGDVVGFLHADDVFSGPDVLASVAAAFDNPGICAVFGDLQYVRRKDVGRVVRHWRSSPFSRQKLEWGWMPPHPTLYVRREWYGRIGGFDTRYKIAADYFSILELFNQPEFVSTYLPKVLVKMRLGGASNRSLRNVFTKSREDLNALQRSGVGALGGFGALVGKNLSKLGQFRVAHDC
jgi:glycosyltransferase